MDMTLRPGDFPLGSGESRAAMRAMLERGEDSRPRLRVIVIHHHRTIAKESAVSSIRAQTRQRLGRRSRASVTWPINLSSAWTE